MKMLLITAVSLSCLAACRGQTSRDEPITGIRNMYDQPRYNVQEESTFFDDHRTMRPLPDGVVAHDQEVNPEIANGRLEDETGYVLTIPQAVVQRSGGMQTMVERGKERYGIYCTPCHDNTGSGEGLVKRRAVAGGAAAFVPPTFHQDRLRHAPDGQIYATITNGKSNMPPYAMQIAVDDRWAIVAYVRALQVAGPKMAAPAAAPTTIPGATAQPPPGGSVEVPPAPAGSDTAPAAAPDAGGAAHQDAAATPGAPPKPTGATNTTRPATSIPVVPAPPPAGSGQENNP
ncbi:MAG: cytochrome c [Labilithrix sp.]|nr:cytochrome c [Labilithrix sp.]MCW5815356.1 cytochrome c [Labilithrix sp.]